VACCLLYCFYLVGKVPRNYCHQNVKTNAWQMNWLYPTIKSLEIKKNIYVNDLQLPIIGKVIEIVPA